jgi:O-antigen/teichoic acid export membrane protein
MGQMGRHSVVYGVGIVVSKAVSFLLLPVYTRYLSPADYGVLQLITMTLEVISIVAGSRIAFGIYHFYHKANGDDARRTVLSTAVVLLAGTYGAAALGAITLAPAVAAFVFGDGGQHVTLVRVAAASLAFEGLALVPMALLQLRDRSKSFVVVTLIKRGLQVALNLVLLIPFRMGVLGVLLSTLAANLLVGLVLAGRVIGEVGLHFHRGAAGEFLRFGLPLVGMQVATFITTFGDRYFLNRAGDTSAVGLYGLAYQFGFLLANVGFLPFQRVWDPQRFAIAKRPDRDAIYARAFVYMNVGLVSAALALSLFAGDILRIIADPAFHAAAVLVPVIVLAYLLQSWGSFLNVGIYITERTGFFTLANWVAAGVALVGYVLLIPRWLAWGAALTTLASLAARCWLAYLFSQGLWRVRYDWAPITRLVTVGLVIGLAGATTTRDLTPYLAVLAHGALFALYVVLLWRLPILSENDRVSLRRLLQKAQLGLVRAA